MKKGLLMLFGGRSMPNMLTVIHEMPNVIIPIISRDMKNQITDLVDSIEKLFEGKNHEFVVDTSYLVDAFDWKQVQTKCIEAVDSHVEVVDWIFNITAATTLMSIGAYEAAKELTLRPEKCSLRCWYLDTNHTNLVKLVGGDRDNGKDEEIFHLTVEQYVAVYNSRLASGISEEQRKQSEEHWLPFVHILIENPSYIDGLKEVIKQVKKNNAPKKEMGYISKIIPTSEETYALLKEASNFNLIHKLTKDEKYIHFEISNVELGFLDGAWLEAYVWDEARNLNQFSDCQWNQRIVDNKKLDDRDSKNELDVSMIYKAQLIIAECKTGTDDLLKSDNIYKLDAVAGILGGKFVSKIFITSSPIPEETDRERLRQHKKFREKAEDHSIEVITREGLPNIREILEKQTRKVRS